MDKQDILDVIPHYLAMFLLVFLALSIIETAVGGLSFWMELPIIVLIVFLYRPAVVRLGVAPDAWEK
jgi:hypothetical protein